MSLQLQPAPAVAYPDGAPGIRMSVEAVAKGMRDGRLDPQIRGWSIDVLAAAGIDGRNHPSVLEQAQALLAAFQKQTIYSPDATGAEWIQAGHVTLCLRDRCIRGGDCDDLTLALGAAMLSIGLSAYAVKVSYGAEHQQHILVGVMDESGKGLYADPSTNRPVSSVVPGAIEEIWVDPMDQVGSTGTVGAEMVTLGKPMARDLYYKGGHWFEFRYGQWWMHANGRWLPGPVDVQMKGLPGLGRPFKRGGSYWSSNGIVDIELTRAQVSEALGLGSILHGNFHTAHELDDLLHALTYQANQIQAAWNAGQAAWMAADPNAANAWKSSFDQAMAAWIPLVARAQTFATTAKTAMGGWQYDYSLALDGFKDFFDEVAEAFQPFEALDRELRQAKTFPQENLPTYPDTPQPTAPDLDLAAYQLADNAKQKIEDVARKVGNVLETAAPYLALAAAAAAIYAVYRVADALPRRASR